MSNPINRLIEFAYYNNHPDNWTITLHKEYYNRKIYKASPIKGWSPNLNFQPLIIDRRSVNVDGEDVIIPNKEKIITIYGEMVPQGSIYIDI